MKIKYEKENEPQKLYHRKPGDVVQLKLNDGKNDYDYYLVLRQGDNRTCLYNLVKNNSVTVSCSIRCVHYPNAELKLGRSKP